MLRKTPLCVVLISYAELPPPTVKLSSSLSGEYARTGKPLSLNCTASTIDHLVVLPTIRWLFPNGSLIVATSTISVSATLLTSLLIVDPVRVADRGNYSCNVIIDIADVTTVVSDDAISISIMSKSQV